MNPNTARISKRVMMALALVTLSLDLSACSENPVGRICDLGGVAQSSQRVVASPSLDCVSRQCLRVPQENIALPAGSRIPGPTQGLCTAECSSDDDCDRVPESPCVTGFSCTIAVTVGPFCCQKFCVCKDYIMVPENGVFPTREACNPANAGAACCNLEGRRGNSAYPNCKL